MFNCGLNCTEELNLKEIYEVAAQDQHSFLLSGIDDRPTVESLCLKDFNLTPSMYKFLDTSLSPTGCAFTGIALIFFLCHNDL